MPGSCLARPVRHCERHRPGYTIQPGLHNAAMMGDAAQDAQEGLAAATRLAEERDAEIRGMEAAAQRHR